MLCTFDFLLFYNFGKKARGTTGNKLQFSFGRTECPMAFSSRQTILRIGQTMSVTHYDFVALHSMWEFFFLKGYCVLLCP